jgi:replicative DNA helicase
MKDLIAEKAILAGICKFGMGGINEVGDIVGEHTFSSSQNKAVFSCLTKVLEKQEIVDIASVMSAASDLNVYSILEKNEALLDDLFNFQVKIESLRNFGERLKRVQLITSAQELLQESHAKLQAFNGDESIDEIYATMETPIIDFALGGDEEETSLLYENIEEYIKYLEENPCDFVGISTGFPLIDNMMGGGIRRKSISLWGCRTGGGKSIMAGMISRHNAKQGIPVLIIDTEMSSEDLISRSLAAASDTHISNIEHGKFEDSATRVQIAGKELKEYPVYYRSVTGKSFEELLSIARRWILKVVGSTNGVTNECLIIYDYFKLMDQSEMGQIQEYQALGFQISKLHDFCFKYDVPVQAFVQTNREDNVSQSDRLQWLASSVSIFSDKTEDEINEDGAEYGNMKLRSLKQRFGPGLPPWSYITMNKVGHLATIKELGTSNDILLSKEKDAEDEDEPF